jgi:4-hydroxybenzoate polyprenyltransferase
MRIHALKKLFFVSRPISWLNTAFPFAAGYIVGGGSINIQFIVGTFYFLVPYNLLMYGINDVFDYESDIRNPRKGGIEGMREDKKFHPTILLATVLINIPFIFFLLLIGNFMGSMILFVLIFFVVAYSIAGIRYKEIPFVDSITSSIHFVGPLIYALSLVPLGYRVPITYIAAFFMWGIASHAFGAVQDIQPDRKAKLSSIATVLGARKTVWLSILFYCMASCLIIYQNSSYFIVGLCGLLYVINLSPYIGVTDKTSPQTNKGWRRFIWLNMFSGFIVTVTLILHLFIYMV